MNRTFKGFYGLLVAGVLSLVLLGGCGGGGGGGGSSSGNSTTTGDTSGDNGGSTDTTSTSTTTISGTVTAPSGISSTSLTIVSLGNTSSASSTGSFSTAVYEEGVTVVAAMSSGKEFGLMNVIVTSTATTSSAANARKLMKVRAAYKTETSSSTAIELSPKTTAVSMVFVTPYFLTSDPERAASLISIIEADPKVTTLADTIESVFNETDPWASTSLKTALTDAITSVLDTIQASVTSSASASKSIHARSSSPKIVQLPKRSKDFSSKLASKTETLYSIDADYTTLDITESSEGYNIDINSRDGNAVDWIGEVGPLDSSQFSSLSDLTDKAQSKDNIYTRTPNQDSAIGRDRAEAKGFLRWIDFIGTAIDTAVESIWSYFFGSGVEISSTTDGVYIVRSFSGGGWGADAGERSLLSSLPNGDSNDGKAFKLNIASAAVDTASAVIPLADYKDCVGEALTTLLGSSESIFSNSMTITSVNDIIGDTVPSVAENFVSGVASCVKEEASEHLIKYIATIIKTSAEEVAKWVSQYKWFEIAGSVGAVAERGTKLYYYATPLESYFVVVGSLFASDTTPPSDPTNLSASSVISATQIDLSWTASTDNIGVSGYNVYRNGSYLKSVTTTNTSDIGLSLSTQYCYTVSAYDIAGNESAQSSSACATTQSTSTAPSAPSGVSATAGDGQVTISWSSVSGATSYNTYWSTSSGVTKTNGTKISNVTSPYTHTGRTNGTTYYYVVTAVNSYGESAESSQVSATPAATGTAPSAPTGITATAGDGQVTISWSSVSGATSYNIYWSTSSGVMKTTDTKITGVTSPYAHTGRTNGTTYYYVVTAVNSYGESAESSEVSAMPNDTSVATGKMPDTGQTMSYTNTFGEDSDYTINSPSYTDNGDGTVTDNVTGLTWQQDYTIWTWDNAVTYCSNLTLAGQTGWRLPSRTEILNIVHYGTYNPAIYKTFFPSTSTATNYWSSTASNTGEAWSVNFYYGVSDPYDYKTSANDVRCVRGEQATPSLTDNGNGTVTDSGSLLTWQQGESSTMTWEAALSYCEGLTLAAQTDWRLPNIKELSSLVDDTRYNPAINTTLFPSATSSFYWSSTTETPYAYGVSAWSVYFYFGSTDSFGYTESFYARCVRGGQ